MSDFVPLRISHLSLGVGDLERSQSFYRDVLGLPLRHRGRDVVVEWPEFLLTLTERPPADRAKIHVGFRLPSKSDVDAWAQRIREAGVDIVSGPAERDGTYQLFFVDPDNYEIELYSE